MAWIFLETWSYAAADWTRIGTHFFGPGGVDPHCICRFMYRYI